MNPFPQAFLAIHSDLETEKNVCMDLPIEKSAVFQLIFLHTRDAGWSFQAFNL